MYNISKKSEMALNLSQCRIRNIVFTNTLHNVRQSNIVRDKYLSQCRIRNIVALLYNRALVLPGDKKMDKYTIYFGKSEFYDVIRKIGGQWNDSKERPIVCLIKLSENDDIYWAIPISSKVEKYEKILNKKLLKYKTYDGLEFGYVKGRKAAFLLQNICPVKEEHIVEKYIDEITQEPIKIPNDVRRKLNAKGRKLINKFYNGEKSTLTDLDYIFSVINS